MVSRPLAYDMCANLSSVMPALSRHPAMARLRRERSLLRSRT